MGEFDVAARALLAYSALGAAFIVLVLIAVSLLFHVDLAVLAVLIVALAALYVFMHRRRKPLSGV